MTRRGWTGGLRLLLAGCLAGALLTGLSTGGCTARRSGPGRGTREWYDLLDVKEEGWAKYAYRLEAEAEAGATIDITPGMGGGDISYFVQSVLDVATPGKAVRVRGDGGDVGAAIVLRVPRGVRLDWEASCSISDKESLLLYFSDGGMVRLGEGARLESVGPTLSNKMDYKDLTLIIDGATVRSTESLAIGLNFNGALVINSGTVESVGGVHTIIANGSRLVINGGEVINDGGLRSGMNTTILADGCEVVINGGSVRSTGYSNHCLHVGGNGSLAVRGGELKATGEVTSAILIGGEGPRLISGGVISVEGDKTSAVTVVGSELVVTGGQIIQAQGLSCRALSVIGGVAVCLDGTIQGEADVTKNADICSLVILVDRLDATEGLDGTSEGLTVWRRYPESAEADCRWLAEGGRMYIDATATPPEGGSQHWTLAWPRE